MQRTLKEACHIYKNNLMKKIYSIFLSAVLIFSACSREKEESTGEVWVRIENATNSAIEDVSIEIQNYGNLVSGAVTEYSQINFPIYAPYCSFMIGKQAFRAGWGVCGTPLPPPMSSGYYTFKVVNSPTPGYYTIELEKR
jgi:hypothetical protein